MGLKPNFPLRSIWTATNNFSRIPVEVRMNTFPFIPTKLLTGRFVGGSVPWYAQNCVMNFAHRRTHQTFYTYFASLVASIVALLPDAELWLPSKS